VADFVYNIAHLQLLNGTMDLDTDDIRILLLTAATDEDPDDVDVQAVLARAGTTEATHTNYIPPFPSGGLPVRLSFFGPHSHAPVG